MSEQKEKRMKELEEHIKLAQEKVEEKWKTTEEEHILLNYYIRILNEKEDELKALKKGE